MDFLPGEPNAPSGPHFVAEREPEQCPECGRDTAECDPHGILECSYSRAPIIDCTGHHSCRCGACRSIAREEAARDYDDETPLGHEQEGEP